jgi:hypothetical protein
MVIQEELVELDRDIRLPKKHAQPAHLRSMRVAFMPVAYEYLVLHWTLLTGYKFPIVARKGIQATLSLVDGKIFD